MDQVILAALGILAVLVGYLAARVERLIQRPIAAVEKSSCAASCHAQACQAEPCQGEPCKASPCKAERVDLSGVVDRLALLERALNAGMAQVVSLAAEERARDKNQHAEVLAAIRADVQAIADREAGHVTELAQLAGELSQSADQAVSIATKAVRAERQQALRQKIQVMRQRRAQIQ